ncbi:hypothetical protein KXX16_007224, partial [Aspergillus fumigatus]
SLILAGFFFSCSLLCDMVLSHLLTYFSMNCETSHHQQRGVLPNGSTACQPPPCPAPEGQEGHQEEEEDGEDGFIHQDSVDRLENAAAAEEAELARKRTKVKELLKAIKEAEEEEKGKKNKEEKKNNEGKEDRGQACALVMRFKENTTTTASR